MTLQVIKAEDVRDGEPRYYADDMADAESVIALIAGGQAELVSWVTSHGSALAIVDRPAPSTAQPPPVLDLDALEGRMRDGFGVHSDDVAHLIADARAAVALRQELAALRAHFDAAAPEHNLPALLDLYNDRTTEARAEIARLTAELAAANTLIASYESPTCDHRHPCRCGSGGHPRRCERHPNAYDRHVVELNAIGKTEAEREDVEVRICTIADEAFGPFPVHSADEACTAIERGAFEQRARIATLEAELAQAARAFGLVDRECSEAVACREDARRALLDVGIALGIDVPPLAEIEPVRANWQRYAAAAVAAAKATAAARAVPTDVEADVEEALDAYGESILASNGCASALNNASRNATAAITRAIGRASHPATVGGLLATACDRHDGDIIEFDDGSNWMQVVVFGGVARWRVHDADDGWFPTSSDLTGWHSDEFIAGWLAAPARFVPAHLADADPASRGPIEEVPDDR